MRKENNELGIKEIFIVLSIVMITFMILGFIVYTIGDFLMYTHNLSETLINEFNFFRNLKLW